MQGTLARRLSFVAAFFMIVSLWFIATPAHAAPLAQASKHHDLSHPVNLATLSKDAAYTVHPYTRSFPLGCYNNVAYAQTESGAVYWQKADSTNTVNDWVQYYWCPKYSGDTVGQNFAYGRDYALKGCVTFFLGDSTSGGISQHYGAMITPQVGNPQYDGYSNVVSFQACNGAYIDDYSVTQPGTGMYKGAMILEANSYWLSVSSPLWH